MSLTTTRAAVLRAVPEGDDWETPGMISFDAKVSESTARRHLKVLLADGAVVSRSFYVRVGTAWGAAGHPVRRTVYQKGRSV